MRHESGEQHTRGAIVAAGTSAALIAQQVAGKAVRDTLFLSSFDARLLPFAMGAAALLSLVVVFWLSRVLVQRSPKRTMPWLFVGSAIGLVLSWAVGFISPPLAALLVYFHTALLGPVLITTFWSLINERFDPHSAKRAVARISGGGTLGGVLGGLLAWRASSLVSLPTTLLLLAALNVLCACGTILITTRRGPNVDSGAAPADQALEATASPAAVLRRTPFLRNLAYLVALGSILSALLDYIFSVQASIALPKGAPLLSFFSLFWLGVGVISFLLQMALGRIALEKLGLAVSIAVLPGTIILGSAFGLVVPGLASSSILRGADAVQRNTLFRSAYELLYTPIPEVSKRATKAIIDVGFDRAGTLIGSLVVVIALRFASHDATTLILYAVVLIALLTLPVVRGLHRGYVQALEQGLREGAQRLAVGSNPIVDAVRASTAADGPTEVRDALIDRVQSLDLGPLSGPDLEMRLTMRRHQHHEPKRVAQVRANGVVAEPNAQRLVTQAADLLSGNVDRARPVLTNASEDFSMLASFAIPLLAHPRLQRDARRALARIAPQATGQLVDVLLDPDRKTMIRRRIPRVLAVCDSQRAADGLVLGLADKSFEIRYECSKALARIRSRIPLSLPRERLKAAIICEAEIEAASRTEGIASKLAAELIEDRRERRLKHIFAILSLDLDLDREPLRIAFKALHNEDEKHRGTALEYLETVLPSDVRDALQPFLGATRPLREPRPAADILADLVRVVGFQPVEVGNLAGNRQGRASTFT